MSPDHGGQPSAPNRLVLRRIRTAASKRVQGLAGLRRIFPQLSVPVIGTLTTLVHRVYVYAYVQSFMLTTKKACHLYIRDGRLITFRGTTLIDPSYSPKPLMYPITGVNRQDLRGCWILGILIRLAAPGRVQAMFRPRFHQPRSSLSETDLPYYSRSLRFQVLIVIIICQIYEVNIHCQKI